MDLPLVMFNAVILLIVVLVSVNLYLNNSIISTLAPMGHLIGISSIFTFDLISLSCVSMLLICFSISVVFYWHYFSWHSDYLIANIQVFVGSMLFLIITNNSINSFIGWEFLGISSFLLILYYNIYCSCNAAIVTVVSSRLGDVGFFIFIGSIFNDNLSMSLLSSLGVFFLLSSKSAVFPLTSWLLEAMRAPTPVSSLVHSSTLVAAGVWLISRYESSLLFNNYSESLLILCLLSIILSATSAFFFSDSKKIIALSTCNNISWCFVYIYNGMIELGLIQLVCHGIFKCILFCLIGDFLVNSINSQNKSNHFYTGSMSHSFTISLVCLFISGFPFLGVYFSKHVISGYLCNSSNILIFCLSFIGLSLSFLYTFRLLSVLNGSNNSTSNGFNNGFNLGVSLIPYILIINSSVSNSLLEDYISSATSVVLLNTFILIMSLLGSFYVYSSKSSWNSSVYGQDVLISDSKVIHGLLENVFYLLTLFRWEQFVVSTGLNIGKSFNSEVKLLFILSLLFYIVAVIYNIIINNILSFQVSDPFSNSIL